MDEMSVVFFSVWCRKIQSSFGFFFSNITRTELLRTANIILLPVAWDCIDQDQGFKCEQDTLLDTFLTEKRKKSVWEKNGVTLKTKAPNGMQLRCACSDLYDAFVSIYAVA